MTGRDYVIELLGRTLHEAHQKIADLERQLAEARRQDGGE